MIVQARLKEYYEKEIAPEMKNRFSYSNKMMIPVIKKVVVHRCLSEALQDSKILMRAADELGLITGQKAIIINAKHSVATYRLRKGQPLSCKVTLRGKKMYEFIDRLINIALPRSKDFLGFETRGVDGRGTYSFGITEQIIFPEVSYDKVDKIRGMDINIVTTASTPEEVIYLLGLFNFPFVGVKKQD